MRMFVKWLICVAAIFLAAVLFPGHVIFYGGIFTLLAAGTILWLLNLLLRPIAQLISLPLTIVSFGIFSFVVNALMVSITSAIVPFFRIRGFFFCLLIALVVSAANTVIADRYKN